eukprot:891120-Karenia_brevis.AAC.1
MGQCEPSVSTIGVVQFSEKARPGCTGCKAARCANFLLRELMGYPDHELAWHECPVWCVESADES